MVALKWVCNANSPFRGDCLETHPQGKLSVAQSNFNHPLFSECLFVGPLSVHKEAVMFHGPASTMKHIQGQRMSLCFVSGCMVPWWSRQVPILPRGPSVPDVFLCVQQYSLGKNILGKDYAPVFQTVGNLSRLQYFNLCNFSGPPPRPCLKCMGFHTLPSGGANLRGGVTMLTTIPDDQHYV